MGAQEPHQDECRGGSRHCYSSRFLMQSDRCTRDLRWKLRYRKLRRARDTGGRDDMLGLLIGAAALGGGFVGARNFVRRRLRFVAAVQRPAAPLVAGLAATAVALPVAALPIVTI